MNLFKVENITFAGALLGIISGLYFPQFSSDLSFFGQLFLTVLKSIIVPLVFLSIFLAIANQKSLNEISDLGKKTFAYFFLTSSIACFSGLLGGLLLSQPESNMLNFEQLEISSQKQQLTLTGLLMSFFSSNILRSFTEGNIVQVVLISLVFGLAVQKISEHKKKAILVLANALNDTVMVLIRWVLYFAPLGVFSLVSSLVSQTSPEAFSGMGRLFMVIFLTAGFHAFFTLPVLGFFIGKFNPVSFFSNIREVLLLALATSSSSATLPVSTKIIEEKERVKPEVAGFVLPLGATINMDGSSLYQMIIVLFLAGLSGISLSFYSQITLFFLILVSSIGTAGIPGGGILMMGMILDHAGISQEYLGFYFLIDRIWDPPITMLNVLSDMFGAKIIDKYQS